MAPEVPELLRRAQARGIVPEDLLVDRTTVWRACRRMGLVTRARPSKREGDMRRWRYPHRMQCVLADGKHFRAGGARAKRVALFFLDDATRYALEAGSSLSRRTFQINTECSNRNSADTTIRQGPSSRTRQAPPH